jgi:fructosamine-3-kinase
MTATAAKASVLLGTEVIGTERLHGGDLSEVARLRTADGRTFVAKPGRTAEVEAGMLRAIRAAGVPAPDVVAVADDLLILEDLGDDEGPGNAWGNLGQVLRRLHSVTGETYGWPQDHAFGKVRIPNATTTTWPEFWAERRLQPSCPETPPVLARKVEALAGRLHEHLPEHPSPALLHGDLWTGNVMAHGAQVTGLIDPSCYYGHAEVDLAMLTLFGSPGNSFWTTYGSLEPGFEERRPIYQLWPALVHLRLFGAGYQGLVERCLQSAG